MAHPAPPFVPTASLIKPSVTRSSSITSTNSANSGASLRRRSRTRTRTLTIAGRRGKSSGPSEAEKSDREELSAPLRPEVPPLPTRSPRRPKTSFTKPAAVIQEATLAANLPVRPRAWSTVHIRDVPVEAQRGRQTKSDGGSIKSTSTESYPESSVFPHSLKDRDEDVSSFSPHVVTQPGSHSDFDVDDVSYRLRLLVNNSYFLPPAHSKPSPLSLTPQNPSAIQKASKPSTPAFLDFFRMGKSKSKPTTPAIHSPTGQEMPSGPILRTTSDSTTASGYAPHPHSSPQAPQAYPIANQNPGSRVVVLRERMDDLLEAAKQSERDIKLRGDGRKAKSQGTPIGEDFFDDVIDPTDAVDLPPPSDGYPFTIQTSAAHGLSPQDSIGAAVLADMLPPSPGMWSMSSEEETWRKGILHEAVSLSLNESPETSFSSMSVGSPDAHSSFRDIPSENPERNAAPDTPKVVIGQRILEPRQVDDDTQERSTLSPLQGLQPLPTTIRSPASSLSLLHSSDTPWRPSINPPRRAETPADTLPLTPPPPRRHLSHQHSDPVISTLAKSDALPHSEDPTNGPPPTVRRSQTSRTSELLREQNREVISMTPPPVSIQQRMTAPIDDHSQSMSSLTAQQLVNLVRESPFSEDDDLSYVTPADGDLDAEQAPRPSMTLSIPSERPSISEYSHPSPTASAFQDALFGSCRTPSPLLFRRSHAGSLGSFGVSPMPPTIPQRDTAVSPPPRTSSSLGATVLPPPPRSPAVKPEYRPSISSTPSIRSSRSSPAPHSAGLGYESQSNDTRFHAHSLDIISTGAIAERRGQPSSLSLRIPTESISRALHSAPAPASPTAFFDSIQSQPNAMDDLDTSDESDDDDNDDDNDDLPVVMTSPVEIAELFIEPRTQAISNRASSSSSRPSFMHFANRSTPQFSQASSHEDMFPRFEIADPRKPIANIAERGTFFASRSRKKSGKGQAVFPLPQYDPKAFASQESLMGAMAGPSSEVHEPIHPRPSPRRPSTAPGRGEEAKAFQRESLQKFDGMLLQHMAAERDRIKRITSNISGSQS
ncbi:hypothetical protein PHLCEN_2v7238 [Hermanssonia centrifuga]|uniref:Uncharacterized protein n=1 Tax=Hermanssonia centrifuga TaxID=98765 RepID=A0A2R6NX97_9APHY|nr:hypothetical protein PHLCEN_2v7238 [Hermanssonia centrifuga]